MSKYLQSKTCLCDVSVVPKPINGNSEHSIFNINVFYTASTLLGKTTCCWKCEKSQLISSNSWGFLSGENTTCLRKMVAFEVTLSTDEFYLISSDSDKCSGQFIWEKKKKSLFNVYWMEIL